MRNERLDFSHNWNGKVNPEAKYLTTIRLYNPRKFAIGSKFDVSLKGVFMGVYEVDDHKRVSIEKIPPWTAKLDTGYPLDECQNIIRTMYKKVDNFCDQSSLSLILLRKIEKP